MRVKEPIADVFKEAEENFQNDILGLILHKKETKRKRS
jgi:hypothetical protein